MRKVIFLLLAGIVFSAYGCGSKPESIKKIGLNEGQEASREPEEEKTANAQKLSLRVCVGSMLLPEHGYAYYKQFLEYIGGKINRKVEFISKESYEQMNALLERNEVDVAFVCGGPYVEAHEKFGAQLLVVPVAHGQPHYYSYIIVNKNSPIKTFMELKGKTFAFSDPMSNSGKIAPAYRLLQMGYTPDNFFAKYIYTYHHDQSLRAVALGSVDGAAVDSLIWEYENIYEPVYTGNTRIIEKLGPYGIVPVAVPKDIDPELKTALQQVFIHAHEDSQGAEILKNMRIDKFIITDDSLFDSIREMKEALKQAGIK